MQRWLCRLTFELSGPRRVGAWAARRRISWRASRPKRQAGGGPLERRVRQHFSPRSAQAADREPAAFP